MKKVTKKRLLIYSIVVVILSLFCCWQNNMLTVSEYTYRTDKIGAELDGFRMVQISDLHNKSFGKEQKRLLKKITELSPDIIVITGDIVDSNHTDLRKALDLVEGAVKIAPTYYITGNHEEWLYDDVSEFIGELEAAGAICLQDQSVTVDKNGDSFTLTGVQDGSLEIFSERCPKLNGGELNVVLAHEPQYIKEYSANGNIDLVLTGHAHGGQFVLPFIGGVIAPDQGFFPEYTDGMHQMGDTTMIISRGLGNSVIPLRLFNFPDVVCVTLEK